MVSTTLSHDAPVGMFDSGVGGLSVLRHIQAQLPHEHLLYVADSGYALSGTMLSLDMVNQEGSAT